MKRGVTVAVCTHNGASRISDVLKYLSEQRNTDGIAWEVLVIDNASTDNTAVLAVSEWKRLGQPAKLRVVHESRLGLSNARSCALATAEFRFVSFVDDDNWVGPDWVWVALETMEADSRVGAIAGRNFAVLTDDPPDWFKQVAYLYAVGDFGSSPLDVTLSPPQLWGAGLTLSVSAWQRLREIGFELALTDRLGSSLSSGGDAELSLALRRAGWQLRYEPRLTLEHAIPRRRLEWAYFRAMVRGSGRSTPLLDPFSPTYINASRLRLAWRRSWVWQAIRALVVGLRNPLAFLAPGLFLREGDSRAPKIEANRGRLQGLLRIRSAYAGRFRKLDALPWDAAGPL